MDKKDVMMWGGLLLIIFVGAALYVTTNKTSAPPVPSSGIISIPVVNDVQVKTVTQAADQQRVSTEKLQYCGRRLVVQKMEVEGVDIVNRILQLTARDTSDGGVCNNLIANLGPSNEVRVEKEVLKDVATFSLGVDGSGEWTYGVAEFNLRNNKLYRVGALDGTESEIGTLK